MKKIPEFKGVWNSENARYATKAKAASKTSGQRPRIFDLACSCGHVVNEVHEVYTPKGEAALRAKRVKRSCGACAQAYAEDDST